MTMFYNTCYFSLSTDDVNVFQLINMSFLPTKIKTLLKKINLNCISKFISYLDLNELSLGYKTG
jgi:hypothetical protein